MCTGAFLTFIEKYLYISQLPLSYLLSYIGAYCYSDDLSEKYSA